MTTFSFNSDTDNLLLALNENRAPIDSRKHLFSASQLVQAGLATIDPFSCVLSITDAGREYAVVTHNRKMLDTAIRALTESITLDPDQLNNNGQMCTMQQTYEMLHEKIEGLKAFYDQNAGVA